MKLYLFPPSTRRAQADVLRWLVWERAHWDAESCRMAELHAGTKAWRPYRRGGMRSLPRVRPRLLGLRPMKKGYRAATAIAACEQVVTKRQDDDAESSAVGTPLLARPSRVRDG
jgi:hypothetical protein